jgi:hypothetical protein
MVTGTPCTETRSHELAPKHLPVHRDEGDNRRPEMDGSMCGFTPRRRPVRGSEFKPAILIGKRHEFIRSFALNFLLCRACIRVDTSRQAGSGICSIAISPVEATAWALHHACIFPQNDFSPHHRRHRGEKSAPVYARASVRTQLALSLHQAEFRCSCVASRCSPCSFCRESSSRDYVLPRERALAYRREHVRTSSCAYMAVWSHGTAATAPPRSCVRLHPCMPLHSGLKATAATSIAQVPGERGNNSLARNMWAGCRVHRSVKTMILLSLIGAPSKKAGDRRR